MIACVFMKAMFCCQHRRFVFAWGVLALVFLTEGIVVANEKAGFAGHPFFKLLAGEWKSEGRLRGANGREVKIEEEWTGRATAEGEFVMEGRRLIDADKKNYVWTFTHDAATGLYTATHSAASNGDETKRFEVSVSEADLTMELRLIGDGDSGITIKDAFADKEHDKLESEVMLKGQGGEITLSGKITHTRVKKP